MSNLATPQRREIPVSGLRSLAWWGDDLVDWLGGQRVALDGAVQRFGVGSTYRFDSAVGAFDLSVTFEALGTKDRLARWERRTFVALIERWSRSYLRRMRRTSI